MKILLYRRSLSLTSGAGQLMRMQVQGLRGAGENVQIACQRGSLRFFLSTGLRAKRLSAQQVESLNNARDMFIVDHGMELPGADLTFVHNLVTEAQRYLDGVDLSEGMRGERDFFARLRNDTVVVANSNLVKAGLIKNFSVAAERIVVLYPGFQSDRFTRDRVERLRASARKALGVSSDEPLVGFVTSGDFHKRGLDLFLESAEQIAAAMPQSRFLVVGSKRLPDSAAGHPIFRNGRAHYRPKSLRPEVWMSALDVFLYPARFEEFGMVVSEAQALGLAVITSRRVGATECMPPEYEPWLIDEPDCSRFATNVLSLLADDNARRELGIAGQLSITDFDQAGYARAAVSTIQHQNR